MAERRMFAKTIIDSDAFLEMPMTAQLLYFHLSMRGDDDGFINKPKAIMRLCGAKDDDLKILFAKKFVIPFDSGVVVIKHWKIHNYIRKDTYTETKYKEEKALLELDENNSYRIADTPPLQLRDETVTGTSTQVRLGKDSLGKDSTTTTTINNTLSYIQSDEFKLFQRVCQSFKDCGILAPPDMVEDFIAYNNSRDWLGIGGESVLDNLDRYVNRWYEGERSRRISK